MIKLSIIIVNYNVKYFLEQAIQSSLKAVQHISAEIIVVDNNSVDGSVELIRNKYPQVIIIANKENTGFSKANNQAIQIANGAYILLLNPDTVVQEDTFSKCIAFMDEHPDAGGLGVKMIDGKGNFLPESKRAFPSPAVAFYKAFGLASLFPKSPVFGKYHLGFLNENNIHQVDVLAGAFMMIRKSVLDEIGLLDEKFFMYGEDIDLSYRIVKAGYKNYYYPETTIIHYKGESTKKGSLNYVKMFYNAMKIFAQKHFSGTRAGLFILLINIAITARAVLSVFARTLKNIAFPLLDAIIIFTGLLLIKEYWEYYVKYIEGGKYPAAYLYVNVPIYLFIWISSIYFSGGYDKNANIPKIIRGIFWGTIIIAAVYGFLPEQFRFSRGMIIAGGAYISFAIIVSRLLLHFIKHKNFRFGEAPGKKIIIVGDPEEAERAHQLLNQLNLGQQIIGYVHTNAIANNSEKELGQIEDLRQITEIYKAGEIIFCGKDIPSSEIIHWIVSLGSQIDYKIIPDQSISIIGSNSKNTAGDLYTVDIQLNIAQPQYKRSKRLLDIFISLSFLITLPVSILFVEHKTGYIKNIFAVLFNRKTWVGYSQNAPSESAARLPAIKKGVLSPLDIIPENNLNDFTPARLNFIYARDYRVGTDFEILVKAFRQSGRI